MKLWCWFATIFAVVLATSACSSDNGGSAPQMAATVEPTEVVETPTAQPTEAVDTATAQPTEVVGLSAQQQDLADAMYLVMLNDEELPISFAEDQVRCLTDGVAGALSDDRLTELGVSAASINAIYGDRGLSPIGDAFEITDAEAFEMVNRVLGCLNWRAFIADVLIAEGALPDQAACIASELTIQGIRDVAMDAMVVDSGEAFGQAEEVLTAFRTCSDVREMLFNMLVFEEGLSTESARCVADGMSDEGLDAMLLEPELEEDEVARLFAELRQLQLECLPPGEIESSAA